jgi:histidyl-tRNA synthetase
LGNAERIAAVSHRIVDFFMERGKMQYCRSCFIYKFITGHFADSFPLLFFMDQPADLFQDFLPDDHEYLTYIKKVLRHRCRQAGFRRISPALVNEISIMEQGMGESGDELAQEHGVVSDKNGEREALVRGCPLSSIARAYVQNDMKDWPQPVELYYIDSFLRRNADARLIEEIDFGVHVMGSSDPALSAQIIYLAAKILEDLGLKEIYSLHINYIGSEESRAIYLEDLKNFYYDKQRSMTEDAIKDYEKGDYLRLLQNADEDMAILAQLAPKLENYLNDEDKEQYENLKGYLDELGIEYKENKSLFGADHYTAHTVFEFWHNDKGAQQTLFCGGSNDEMIAKFGGEKINTMGFSTDCKKIISDMRIHGIRVPHKDHIQVFVAQLGVNAKKKALSLLQQLRDSGIQAVGAMGTGSMRTQLDMASDFGVKFCLLLGEVEVREGMVIARDMTAGTQESVPIAKVVQIMQERIGKEKIDVMDEKEKSVDLK